MKQHLGLVKMVDPGFGITEFNQTQEVMNMNLDKTIFADSEDVNLRTLVNSNLTSEIEKKTLFFCHECSSEVANSDSLETHMEKHFMEFSIESNASISTGNIKDQEYPVPANLFCSFVHKFNCT